MNNWLLRVLVMGGMVAGGCTRPRDIQNCSSDAQCPGGRCIDFQCDYTAGGSSGTGGTGGSGGGGDTDQPIVDCTEDAGCPAQQYCQFQRGSSATTGFCAEDCRHSDDCPFLQICEAGRCYTADDCQTSADCHPDEGCHPTLGQCLAPTFAGADWCRLDRPNQITVAGTEQFDVYAMVREPGITDRSNATDRSSRIIGQIGVGPPNSDPSNIETWRWTVADTSPNWVDTNAPGVDEYVAVATAPGLTGTYDYAFRFQVDGTGDWTYCDTNTGVTGEDGSENGYQPENAGALSVTGNPCSPNPCLSPGQPSCDADGVTLLVPASPGFCTPSGVDFDCEYPAAPQDCSRIGGTCENNACTGIAEMPTSPGQIIVTEFMVRTMPGNDWGEWVELYNPTNLGFNLDGCELHDDDSDSHTIAGLVVIGIGESVILARSPYQDENHGLPTPNYVYDSFFLSNSNDDEIVLSCNGAVIDWAKYTANSVQLGTSLALDPTAYDHVANDEVSTFCMGNTPYGDGSMRGTPGEKNPPCPPPDTSIDTCRVVADPSISATEGVTLDVAARMFNLGLTDRSDGIDEHVALRAEAGYGPEGSDPLVAAGWTWVTAAANLTWDASQSSDLDFDEYLASFTAPAVGTWDYAFRFSLDSGATWVACDRDAGDAAYDPIQAAELVTVPNPCSGDPCPPVNDCDGTISTTAPAGICTFEGITPSCAYDLVTFDCATITGTCNAGVCSGDYRKPTVGEVVITEIMHTPAATVDPSDGQWIELFNPTAANLLVHDCEIELDAGATRIGGMVIPAGDRVLFAGALAGNGGLTANHALDVDLDPSGDSIRLRCDEVAIDTVSYDGGILFPAASGVALQLAPAQSNASANDNGANWCLSRAPAMVSHFGTPGEGNVVCKNAPEACRLEWGADLTDIERGTPLAVAGRVEDRGITDVDNGPNPHPALWVQSGYGVAGTDPDSDSSWNWFDTTVDGSWSDPLLDGYNGSLTAPAPGNWDIAFRTSGDGGRNWMFCDRDGGAYSSAQAGHLATIPASGANLFFSEYVEGSSLNKALEIFNAGSSTADLSSCVLRLYFNGNHSGTDTDLADATLPPGEIWVICHSGIDSLGACDQSTATILFNGNDAVELICDGTLMDAIGEVGFDPGKDTGWSNSVSTLNQTLRRNCNVTVGDRDSTDAFDPDTEWSGEAQDTLDGLGSRGCP